MVFKSNYFKWKMQLRRIYRGSLKSKYYQEYKSEYIFSKQYARSFSTIYLNNSKNTKRKLVYMQNLTLQFIKSDFVEIIDQNVHQRWHIRIISRDQRDLIIRKGLLWVTFDHKYFTILWTIYFSIRMKFSRLLPLTYRLRVYHQNSVVLDCHSRQSIQHRRDDQVYWCDLGFHYTHFKNYPLAHEAAELILTFSRIHFLIVVHTFSRSFLSVLSSFLFIELLTSS